MSVIDTLPPLYMRRPPAVSEEIALEARMAAVPVTTYKYYGQGTDYELAPGFFASELVAQQTAKFDRPLRILDIGAGVGGFVLERLAEGHTAQGLSLHDYRKATHRPELAEQADSVPDDAYVVGDAQNMHGLRQLRDDYDLVVSRWTFPHMIDQLGTLEQVADRLGPGGIVAVTRLATDFGYTPWIDAQEVIETLEKAGFDTNGSVFSDDDLVIALLIAERGEDAGNVRFPVEFRTDEHSRY